MIKLSRLVFAPVMHSLPLPDNSSGEIYPQGGTRFIFEIFTVNLHFMQIIFFAAIFMTV